MAHEIYMCDTWIPINPKHRVLHFSRSPGPAGAADRAAQTRRVRGAAGERHSYQSGLSPKYAYNTSLVLCSSPPCNEFSLFCGLRIPRIGVLQFSKAWGIRSACCGKHASWKPLHMHCKLYVFSLANHINKALESIYKLFTKQYTATNVNKTNP